MIRESISIEQALEVLNRAFEADPDAMVALRAKRVVCKDALGLVPGIRAGMVEVSSPPPGGLRFDIGFLGLINGLFGADERTGYGAIAMVFDLVCPDRCDFDGARVYDGGPCPVCGKTVERLYLGFRRMDPSELPNSTME